jgi:glycerate kinase
MKDMSAFYGRLNGTTAVIELAACAGLTQVEGSPNPMVTTTYGVGQLMLHAAESGAKRLIVGLGGSATNDGGCGAAAACGVEFYAENGQRFIPVGGSLQYIHRIDADNFNTIFNNTKITVMCDVANPMFGENGAAYIFAPQKGATPENVLELDAGLRHLAEMIKRDIGKDVSAIPGAGAAGAAGAGMVAFFNATLRSGIDVVLDTLHFDRCIAGADCIITGEGRFDRQSLGGKAVMGIARRAKKQGVPVVVIAGGAEPMPEAYAEGVTAVFTINRHPEAFETARHKSEENLYETAFNLFKLMETTGLL